MNSMAMVAAISVRKKTNTGTRRPRAVFAVASYCSDLDGRFELGNHSLIDNRQFRAAMRNSRSDPTQDPPPLASLLICPKCQSAMEVEMETPVRD